MQGNSLIVGVGIPTLEMWVPEFGLSLTAMGCYFGMKRFDGYREQTMKLFTAKGSMLSESRESLVLSALKANCKYLLMVDTDMKFPRELLHQWVKIMDRGEVKILSANCTTKAIPAEVTATGFQNERIFTDEDSHGIQEVESVGCAVTLIDVKIFQKIPRPWFNQEWQPELQHFCGEDRYFMRKARAHGFKNYIDHDISKQVSHYGSFAYNHDVVGEIKETEDGESKVA